MTDKTYILIEIDHQGQLTKSLNRDLPRSLSKAALELITARGGSGKVKAKHIHQPSKETNGIHT